MPLSSYAWASPELGACWWWSVRWNCWRTDAGSVPETSRALVSGAARGWRDTGRFRTVNGRPSVHWAGNSFMAEVP